MCFTSLNAALWVLDEFLTGNDLTFTSEACIFSILQLLSGEEMHLSDGGYSKIYFDTDISYLILISESKRIKGKWDGAVLHRKRIEDEIKHIADICGLN